MKQLLWHEPARYSRAKYSQMESLAPMRSVKFALFTFFVFLGFRWLGGLHPAPGMHPPGWAVSTGAAVGVAVFAAYVLPRLVGLFAKSIVILSEKGVNNNTIAHGVTIRFWPWSAIAFCYVWTEALYNDHYPVLSFCDDCGIVLTTVARSEKVSLSEIERTLHACGIPIQYDSPLHTDPNVSA